MDADKRYLTAAIEDQMRTSNAQENKCEPVNDELQATSLHCEHCESNSSSDELNSGRATCFKLHRFCNMLLLSCCFPHV